MTPGIQKLGLPVHVIPNLFLTEKISLSRYGTPANFKTHRSLPSNHEHGSPTIQGFRSDVSESGDNHIFTFPSSPTSRSSSFARATRPPVPAPSDSSAKVLHSDSVVSSPTDSQKGVCVTSLMSLGNVCLIIYVKFVSIPKPLAWNTSTRPCYHFYLSETCTRSPCRWSHSPILSPTELEELRNKAKSKPCGQLNKGMFGVLKIFLLLK